MTRLDNLGGILDSSLQFKAHITNKCKAAMVNLIWIKKHQKIHQQQHMPHISQSISSISHRLLQFHTCRPTKNVNKCNATCTKHQSKNRLKQKLKR